MPAYTAGMRRTFTQIPLHSAQPSGRGFSQIPFPHQWTVQLNKDGCLTLLIPSIKRTLSLVRRCLFEEAHLRTPSFPDVFPDRRLFIVLFVFQRRLIESSDQVGPFTAAFICTEINLNSDSAANASLRDAGELLPFILRS